jgi:hypothetical protein
MADTDPVAAELAAIERPNGKLYRPRKINCYPVADEDDFVTAVIVFGTHDVERARPLADSSVKTWADSDYTAGNPETGWWRQAMRNGDLFWVDAPVTGRAGVRFEAVPDGMEKALAVLAGLTGKEDGGAQG